jgi:betaine-aldehyde dehydrogenase
MTALEEIKRLSGKLSIGGEFRDSTASAGFDVVDPATEDVIGRIPDSTTAEVDEAITVANRIQKAWNKVNALTRAELMHQVATNMRQSRGVVGEMLTREMGKPYKETTDEVDWSATAIDYYAEIARHDNGRVIGPAVDDQFHFTVKEPMGVVVIILPFNYPLCLFCWEAAAALATGNAVIVKPSENSALSTLKFMEAFAPLPDGLVQCLPGGAKVGSRLVESTDTHMVAFTGGVPTGQIVARACADQFKRCLIEASGNDPFLVMPSAPLDMAARGATFAAYLNCGQVCTSAERFFVHTDIHDAFVEKMVANARALRIGNGLDKVDMGPMVTAKERERYEGVIRRAVEQGAKVACGGGRPAGFNKGWYVEATGRGDRAGQQVQLRAGLQHLHHRPQRDDARGQRDRDRHGMGQRTAAGQRRRSLRRPQDDRHGPATGRRGPGHLPPHQVRDDRSRRQGPGFLVVPLQGRRGLSRQRGPVRAWNGP